jgi:hypothetical protein
MPTFGSAASGGAPVQFTIAYDGTTKDWGSSRLLSIGDYSNESDSLDNSYKIGALSCQLIDTDGSIWSEFGSGTNCLRKSFSVLAHIGGTTSYRTDIDGATTPYVFGTQGAYTATVFTGRVSQVSRSNRVVKVTGENIMRTLSRMKWQPPVSEQGLETTKYGSFYFFQSSVPAALNRRNVTPDGGFDCYGYDVGTDFGGNLSSSYPPISGRFVNSDWYSAYNTIPGTQFYYDFTRLKFGGTLLGTYFGTVTSTEEAYSLGYPSLAEAEADVVRSSAGTYYPRNMYRLENKGTVTVGTIIHTEGTFALQGGPGTLFTWLTTSRLVEPFFSGTDINSAVTDFTNQVVPSYTFSRIFDDTEDMPFDTMKDLFQSTQALFSVNSANQFEFRAYGPVDLSVTPPSIPAGDILDASIAVEIEEYANRVVFRYAYDPVSDDFGKNLEVTSPTWTREIDEVREVESKWIHSHIDAEISANRLLGRYSKGRPRIEINTPLNNLKYGIGTVLTLTDTDSFGSARLSVVTGYSYQFEERKMTLIAEDGEALYRQRGYARFDSIGGTVTGTSKSGFSASGTVHNINSTLYGSIFRFF